MKPLLRPAILVGLCLAAGGAYYALREPFRAAKIEYWHGQSQRVGHLGRPQPDFNLMGVAEGRRLTGKINGGAPLEITIAEGEDGFRRLGGQGHFNFEIPISELRPGTNDITLEAEGTVATAAAKMSLEYTPEGSTPSPFEVLWTTLDHPQDAGQIVDGKWELTDLGLRSREHAYDRLFLLGDATWRDYEVRTRITVHSVAAETGPNSGAPGVGLIMRFTGHVIDPPRFPQAQPKWGFQPFGAMQWLRFVDRAAPVRQFYRGDRNESQDHAPLEGFETGRSFELLASCRTDPSNADITHYAFTIWPSGEDQPEAADYDIAQESTGALRRGGLALVVHHADVTFGDLMMRRLD